MDVKRVFTCAALLAGLLFFNGRLLAAVESATVGYTTMKTTAGFNMLGVVFNGLDGQALPLAKAVEGDFQDEDEIQVYNKDTGYASYTYWKDYGGWLDGNFAPATQLVAPGTSFWLKTPGREVEVVFKGAVSASREAYVCKAGLQMVSANLPVELDLNGNAIWTGLTDGDEIQVRKGNAYTSYSYWKDFGGWLDGDFNLVTEKLPVGASFWLKVAKPGATLTIGDVSK